MVVVGTFGGEDAISFMVFKCSLVCCFEDFSILGLM